MSVLPIFSSSKTVFAPLSVMHGQCLKDSVPVLVIVCVALLVKFVRTIVLGPQCGASSHQHWVLWNSNVHLHTYYGKRLFVKELVHHITPPNDTVPEIAQSLMTGSSSSGNTSPTESFSLSSQDSLMTEEGNPTVIPEEYLRRFHFTFLIRDPHFSVPSFYRCTIPPASEATKFFGFDPSEMAYNELRKLFDYLRVTQQIQFDLKQHTEGTAIMSSTHTDHASSASPVDICLLDAHDLLDYPDDLVRRYCDKIGIDFHPEMLNWSDEDSQRAEIAFERWKGFHDDAINSKGLKSRTNKIERSREEWDVEWISKYGEHGAKVIRKTVDDNMGHYTYLKQFSMKPQAATCV